MLECVPLSKERVNKLIQVIRKIPLFDSVPECDKDDFLTTVSMSLRAEAYAKVRPLTRD